MNAQLKRLSYGGLFLALVTVATMYIRVPTLIGYANLGDGFILGSAVLLGPFAAVVGGVGSALADLLLGYSIYAPATLVIKGLMGLCAALFIRKGFPFRLLGFVLAELIMVLGYFAFECFAYTPASALLSVPANLMQGLVGIAVALALNPLLQRLKER
ncbi:MAG: ECF transporter S component [Christensenellaceae bacterium]|nr:ECF transporter S component [Christensenellaceae bacterium]